MKHLRVLIAIALIGLTLASCTSKDDGKNQESTPDSSSQSSSTTEGNGTGSTQAPADSTATPAPKTSDPNRKASEKKVFGVKFLGSALEQTAVEELLRKELTEEQRKNLTMVQHDGTESYLIVPKEDMVMTVYELSLGSEGLTRGATLAQCKKGGPLYLTCNISDITPNVILVVQDGETEYTYTPAISLKDGQVELGDWGYALQ